MESIKDRIYSCARLKDISIPDLEKKCGLSNGAIGKWDKCAPSAPKLFAVAEALETTMEYLLNGYTSKYVSELVDNVLFYHDKNEQTMRDMVTSSPADKMLYDALHDCTEEEKLKVVKIIEVLKK